MNEAQKIEEGAIIDARGDFEAINEWLEKQKKKISEFKISNPGKLYGALSLFSLGYFLGAKSNPKLRFLYTFLGGAVFGFSAIQTYKQIKLENDPSKSEEEKTVTELQHVQVIEPTNAKN